jgi:mannose-6-phosphate isomerase-like protein (cupin superfamily)
VTATAVGLSAAQAPPGIQRTNLLREDLSAPGVSFPRHSHPGEEIVYVTEGSLVYELEGRPPTTLEAGDTLFIPAGAIHAVKNVGGVNGAELATYVVKAGQQLITLAD